MPLFSFIPGLAVPGLAEPGFPGTLSGAANATSSPAVRPFATSTSAVSDG